MPALEQRKHHDNSQTRAEDGRGDASCRLPQGGRHPGQQNAYDLLAQLEGYKSWAHWKVENAAKAQADNVEPIRRYGHTQEEIADWPVWVFFTAYSNRTEDEELCVMPFGTTAEDIYAHNFGPELPDGDQLPGVIIDDDLVANDEERARNLVVREVLSWFPRAERYGFPMSANDRKVAKWLEDDFGWRYLVGPDGDSLVETHSTDTGTDGMGTCALVTHVSPEVHEKLNAMFADE